MYIKKAKKSLVHDGLGDDIFKSLLWCILYNIEVELVWVHNSVISGYFAALCDITITQAEDIFHVSFKIPSA